MKNVQMDIAKAIGIILIVMGHSFVENSDSVIRSFVYLFHVPFFFIISGYFFKESYLHNPIQLILRRLKRLWVPFFLWSTLFICLHNSFFACNIYSTEIQFRGRSQIFYSFSVIAKKIIDLFFFKSSEQLLGAFWFLPVLFFSVMLFAILLKFSLFAPKGKQIATLITLALSCFCIAIAMYTHSVKLPLPINIRLILIATFLYCMGFLYHKYESKIPLTFPVFIVCVVLLALINALDIVKIDSINSVVVNFKYALLYLILTPAIGTYVTLYLSQVLAKTVGSKILVGIGGRTITILALHFISFKFVSAFIVITYNLPKSNIAYFPVIPGFGRWYLLYTIIGITLPVLFDIFILDRIRIMASRINFRALKISKHSSLN